MRKVYNTNLFDILKTIRKDKIRRKPKKETIMAKQTKQTRKPEDCRCTETKNVNTGKTRNNKKEMTDCKNCK